MKILKNIALPVGHFTRGIIHIPIFFILFEATYWPILSRIIDLSGKIRNPISKNFNEFFMANNGGYRYSFHSSKQYAYHNP